MKFDTKVSKGEKDQASIRAHEFMSLTAGEFVALSDGKEQKIKFKYPRIHVEKPKAINTYSQNDLEDNFERIMKESLSLLS